MRSSHRAEIAVSTRVRARIVWLPVGRDGGSRKLQRRPSRTRAAKALVFSLRFKLPDYLIELYRDTLKNDLARINGDSSWTLPMPARYVIGTDGVIAYAEVKPNYTRRPDPQ